MTNEMIWEIIGYAGSLLVLISLLMSSVIKLRILNLTGSLVFSVYALVIQSYPTAVMNIALVFINVYYLVKILNTKKAFSLVEASLEDATVHHFLSKYSSDISKFFGIWDENIEKANKVYLALNDDNVAGITLGTSKENGEFELLVDYSTPQFRDCKLGRFVYTTLLNGEYRLLSYGGASAIHTEFVKKMGFSEENGRLVNR